MNLPDDHHQAMIPNGLSWWLRWTLDVRWDRVRMWRRDRTWPEDGDLHKHKTNKQSLFAFFTKGTTKVCSSRWRLSQVGGYWSVQEQATTSVHARLPAKDAKIGNVLEEAGAKITYRASNKEVVKRKGWNPHLSLQLIQDSKNDEWSSELRVLSSKGLVRSASALKLTL